MWIQFLSSLLSLYRAGSLSLFLKYANLNHQQDSTTGNALFPTSASRDSVVIDSLGALVPLRPFALSFGQNSSRNKPKTYQRGAMGHKLLSWPINFIIENIFSSSCWIPPCYDFINRNECFEIKMRWSARGCGAPLGSVPFSTKVQAAKFFCRPHYCRCHSGGI